MSLVEGDNFLEDLLRSLIIMPAVTVLDIFNGGTISSEVSLGVVFQDHLIVSGVNKQSGSFAFRRKGNRSELIDIQTTCHLMDLRTCL